MDIGLNVMDECYTHYNDLRSKKAYRYLIFKVKDDKSIGLEHVGEREKGWEDFKNLLNKDDARFAVYDFHHKF